ncbi:MAG TPA: hypothetical protein DCZ40_14270 [Lachnospiraceae bacterium]|nr:hypothetical protein [Lachnospiraceae bacterium]
MLNRVAVKLAAEVLKDTGGGEEKQEIYVYGIELIISTGLIFITILVFSALCGDVMMGVVFLSVFAPLRLFTGGYHADTYGKCYVITILLYGFTMFLQSILQPLIPMRVLVFALLLMTVYISMRSPVRHVNQPLSEHRKQVNARMASAMVIVDLFYIWVLSRYSLERMENAAFAMGLVTALMLLADIKNSRKGGIRRGDYCENY